MTSLKNPVKTVRPNYAKTIAQRTPVLQQEARTLFLCGMSPAEIKKKVDEAIAAISS